LPQLGEGDLGRVVLAEQRPTAQRREETVDRPAADRRLPERRLIGRSRAAATLSWHNWGFRLDGSIGLYAGPASCECAESETRFLVEGSDYRFVFLVDETRKVTGVSLEIQGLTLPPARRIEQTR
jgi:hypothetical protein